MCRSKVFVYVDAWERGGICLQKCSLVDTIFLGDWGIDDAYSYTLKGCYVSRDTVF